MKRKSIRFHFFGHEKLLQDLFKFKSKFYLLRSIIERDTFVQLNAYVLFIISTRFKSAGKTVQIQK